MLFQRQTTQSRESQQIQQTPTLSLVPNFLKSQQIQQTLTLSLVPNFLNLPQRRTCVDPVALPRETPCVVSPRPQLSALPRRQRVRPFPPKLRSFKKLSSRSLDSFRPIHLRVSLRSLPACLDARTRDALLPEYYDYRQQPLCFGFPSSVLRFAGRTSSCRDTCWRSTH